MEARLFAPEAAPEYAQAEWYAGRETAPHLEQAGHRERLFVAADLVARIDGPTDSIIDVGAGDGGLLSLLARPGRTLLGYDLQPSNVQAAKARGVDVRYGDVVTLLRNDPTFTLAADVVLCTEMLEHLVDPHGFLRRLDAPWLVASSPYTETEASHYEFHLWAWDVEGYRQLLAGAGWEVVHTQLAWICQVVLARRVNV